MPSCKLIRRSVGKCSDDSAYMAWPRPFRPSSTCHPVYPEKFIRRERSIARFFLPLREAEGAMRREGPAVRFALFPVLGRVAQPRAKVKSRLGSTLRVPHPFAFFFSAKGAGLDAELPNPQVRLPFRSLINLSSRAKHRALFLPLRAAEGAMRREGSAVRFVPRPRLFISLPPA